MKLIGILLAYFLCTAQIQAQKLTTNTYLKNNLTKELANHEQMTELAIKQQALAEKISSNAQLRLGRITNYNNSTAVSQVMKSVVDNFIADSNTYLDQKYVVSVDSLTREFYSQTNRDKKKKKKKLKNRIKDQEKLMKYYSGEKAIPKSQLQLTQGKRVYLVLSEIERMMNVILE